MYLIFLIIATFCIHSTLSKTDCLALSYFENSLLKFQFFKAERSTLVILDVRDKDQFLLLAKNCIDVNKPMNWHIHTKSDFGLYGIGPEACSASLTGGHFDPMLACGASSGNPMCKALKEKVQHKYKCNNENYLLNRYVCESGDLSGKYGQVSFSENADNLHLEFQVIDDNDTLNPCNLKNKSIVIHCPNSLNRLFCAKIIVKATD